LIRAVISDFGGVLTTPLIESFLAYQRETGIALEDLGTAMARLMEEDDGRHPLFELEKGNLSEQEFIDRLGAQLGRKLDTMSSTYFANLHPNEPMIAYMRGLKADGLRLGLLTNNVREWEPYWRTMLPVDEVFDVVVDSGFVGMRKPEPGIYELTLQRLELPGEACVFLDDLEVNVEAARAQGMRGVVYRDAGQAIAEIDALLG
jgi:putative hydrolase of the HAD superfamily